MEPNNGKTAPSTRYFLNALREKDRSLPTPKRGIWHQDVGFLSKYAQDIDLQGQLPSANMAHSTPSVFQRPLQFYEALRESKNPLHDAIAAEWRGLMAVVGLSRWLDLNVEVKPFTVPQGDAFAKSKVGATGNKDLHLRTILRNQLPKRDQDWESWWLIFAEGELLGATSPWSVVYTAAQYSAPAIIPWQTGGRLVDPRRHYDPTGDKRPVELAILHAWLDGILANRGAWGFDAALGTQEAEVAKLIEQWKTELSDYARDDVSIPTYASLFPEPAKPPFSVILQQPDELAIGASDLLLRSVKVRQDVLILSEKLPASTRVYRGLFADRVDVTDLAPEGNQFTSKDGKTIYHAYAVAETCFFPSKLVRVQLSDQALRRGPDISLPLTPAFFRYLNHSDLTDKPNLLTVTEVGDSYKATLRLPLKNKPDLVVEHVYSDQDVETLDAGTPAFGLWPNFHDERWIENFAAFGYEGPDDVRTKPLFTDGSQSAEEATPRSHQKDIRIWPCQRPPIGFALTLRDKTTGDLHRAGLILRGQRLEDLRPPGLNSYVRWDIGVDFGTSSTTVMRRKNAGQVEQMPFAGRTVFLTNQDDRNAGVANSLYPAAPATPPFRTLLYESAATVFGLQKTQYTLRFTSQAGQDDTNKPVSDVKWGRHSSQTDTNPLVAYLDGLVRYIVCEARAEGAGNLVFHWSYPLSLPAGALSSMRLFWSSVVNSESYARSGMIVTVENGISESEAVCRCLAPILNVQAGSLTIAIDVGGGSTDIAFWSANTLLDQFSFKIAGNDVLDRTYLKPDTIRKIFEICYGQAIPEAYAKDILQRSEIYLNGALTEAKDSTGEICRSLNPRQHPIPYQVLGRQEASVPWVNLRSMTYIFFSGLFYYLGVHTRMIDVPLSEVDIYVGGRGSALLTWLASPENTEAMLTSAFKAGLEGGPDTGRRRSKQSNVLVPKGLPIRFSSKWPALKIEVAQGLLSPKLSLKGKALRATVVGEVGWTKDNEPVPWSLALGPEDMANLSPPDNFDSTTIGDFRNVMLKQSKYLEDLNLDRTNLPSLYLLGADVQNLIKRSADGEDHLSQPIFAYELKVLMRKYADTVAEGGASQSVVA